MSLAAESSVVLTPFQRVFVPYLWIAVASATYNPHLPFFQPLLQSDQQSHTLQQQELPCQP